MFANINLGVLNFAFPDVCKLLPVPIPFPFPNFALSFTHIPSVFNVIFGGGLAENLMTQGTVSLGDISAGGVVSQIELGPDRQILGSFKVTVGVMFATRLTTVTMQNGMPPNAVGMSITPAQFRVILLS